MGWDKMTKGGEIRVQQPREVCEEIAVFCPCFLTRLDIRTQSEHNEQNVYKVELSRAVSRCGELTKPGARDLEGHNPEGRKLRRSRQKRSPCMEEDMVASFTLRCKAGRVSPVRGTVTTLTGVRSWLLRLQCCCRVPLLQRFEAPSMRTISSGNAQKKIADPASRGATSSLWERCDLSGESVPSVDKDAV